jgi:hypothetical protein
MLLSPKDYRVDDLLRRPFAAHTPFVGGARVRVGAPEGWGFGGMVSVDGVGPLAPFALSVRAENTPVVPQEGIFRPSHVTLHGVDSQTGLQVTEDKFVTDDDVLVSALWLRNPSELGIGLELSCTWGLRAGMQRLGSTAIAVHRLAPPGDDLFVTLPANGRLLRVFAMAFGDDPEEAHTHALRRAARDNPARVWAEGFDAAFATRVPRFDHTDPWLVRLWNHAWCAAREAPLAPGTPRPFTIAEVRAAFEQGDFDRPRAGDGGWRERIVGALVGLTPLDDDVIRLGPDPALAGPAFCLEAFSLLGRSVTVVWDDPATSDDAYHDGDKGLTVYAGRQRIWHQEDLSAVEIRLPEA